MFARLLESRKNRQRSVWGAVVSTIAHTAVIALAVFATAQARAGDPPPPEILHLVTPPVSKPAPAAPPLVSRRPTDRPSALPPTRLIIDRIDLVIPPVDVTLSNPEPGPVALLPGTLTAGLDADGLSAAGSNEPYSGDQVERQVYLRRGSPSPRYPNSLRAAGVEGQVTALFVVSETGQVESATVRFTRSDDPLFEKAVREALAEMRFIPAEIGGKKVRQLVQMPFVFTLTR